MERIFKPVVSKIIGLLQSQLDAEKSQTGKVTIKVRMRLPHKTVRYNKQATSQLTRAEHLQTILLVGGFGDSAYLNTALRDWCEKRKIRLLCPEHP